jgi:SAM-dependent methyltransferase
MDLNIIKGDMTNLPFDDGKFSFLFSYNTSVHMQKCDFAGAIREFSRVLIPGGLCFVNFLNSDCDTYGRGIEIAPGEFLQMDCGEEVQYTHYKDDEPVSLFDGFDIIYSEKSKIKRNVDGRNYTSGYLNFILKRL